MFLTASRLDMFWLNVYTLCLSLCFLYVHDLCDNKHFWIELNWEKMIQWLGAYTEWPLRLYCMSIWVFCMEWNFTYLVATVQLIYTHVLEKWMSPFPCMLVKYYAKCLDDCSVYWLACLLCRTVSRENKPVVEPAREKSESKPVVERYQCSLTISVLVVLRTCHWLGAFSSDSARKQHDRLFSLAFQLNPLLHRSHIHIFTLVFISPPASTKLKGGILVSPCPQSGCPSICGRNRVCSVSSTILAESIAFLHVLSTNFKRCVSCWIFFFKIFPKIKYLLNFYTPRQWSWWVILVSLCLSVHLSIRPSVYP